MIPQEIVSKRPKNWLGDFVNEHSELFPIDLGYDRDMWWWNDEYVCEELVIPHIRVALEDALREKDCVIVSSNGATVVYEAPFDHMMKHNIAAGFDTIPVLAEAYTKVTEAEAVIKIGDGK